MRLLNLVLNLILVSALFFFFNSEYPEPETAETVLSLSPFFRWGCYFRRNWRLWFWRGLFGDFEYFFSLFFLLKEDPLIGVYVSFCMFWLEFLEKWIPEGERSPGNITLHPTSFRTLMRIFLQTRICCCFSWGKKRWKHNVIGIQKGKLPSMQVKSRLKYAWI